MAESRTYRFFAFLISIIPRLHLHRNMRRLVAAYGNTKSILKHELARAKECNATSFERMNRIGLYISIIEIDIAVLNARFAIEIDEEIKDVYARHIALLIHEYLDDQPDLFGKDFRQIVMQLPNSSKYLSILDSLGKNLRSIRKTHGRLLSHLRNNVIAHRDHDGEKQLNAIESIKLDEMRKLAKAIQTSITNHVSLLTKVSKGYAYSKLQIREISKGIEQAVADS